MAAAKLCPPLLTRLRCLYVLGPRSFILGQAQYVLLERRSRVFVRRRYAQSNHDHQELQVGVGLAVEVYLPVWERAARAPTQDLLEVVEGRERASM